MKSQPPDTPPVARNNPQPNKKRWAISGYSEDSPIMDLFERIVESTSLRKRVISELGIHTSTVNHWLTGRSRLRDDQMCIMADLLQVPLAHLFFLHIQSSPRIVKQDKTNFCAIFRTPSDVAASRPAQSDLQSIYFVLDYLRTMSEKMEQANLNVSQYSCVRDAA